MAPTALRRDLGQFDTPAPVAEAMALWAGRGGAARSLLDPACGTGILLREHLRRARPGVRALGFDVDPRRLAVARRALGSGPRLLRRDYLSASVRARFEAVVANPPYLPHGRLRGAEALRRRVSRLSGVPLERTTNAYALFLLKSLGELVPGGRLAYLVPSEMLDMDWGRPVKGALLEAGLRAVVFFDPRLRLFPDALTSSALILCERSAAAREVALAWVRNLGSLASVLAAIEDGLPPRRARAEDLRAEAKWSGLFLNKRPLDRGLVPLSRYGRCLRGIATGHNAFFMMSANEAAAGGLSRETVFCLAKARHAPGAAFTRADARRLLRAGERCLLLDVRGRPGAAARRYLARGVALRVHRRHLTSRRRPWHAREGREPADLWLPVFFRDAWRAVDNRARALQLTAFHGLYLNAPGRRHRVRLWRYLNSAACRKRLEARARRLGGGLKKLEPKDLEGLPVPSF